MAQVLLLNPITTEKELIEQKTLAEILSCKSSYVANAKKNKVYNRKIKMFILPPETSSNEITKILSDFKIDDEIWLHCPKARENVKVSNYGRIAKVRPNGELRVYQLQYKEKRRTVRLSVMMADSKRKEITLARYVASAFLNYGVYIPENYAVVHKNGKKWDNSVANLEIIDMKDTCKYGDLSGRNKYVAKIDPWTKDIIDVYSSYHKAARDNYIACTCIRASARNNSEPIYGRFQWKEITEDEYYDIKEMLLTSREDLSI